MALFLSRLVVLVLALGSVKDAAARDFCTNWRSTSDEPMVHKVAMLENIKQLDGSKVDKACLVGQVDALVRWANRLCGSRSMEEKDFAFAFVRETRSRCP